MEANDNLEQCVSLNDDLKLSKNNIFDSESPCTKESPVKGSMNSSSKDKSIEISNNEIKHIQIPSEVFKSKLSENNIFDFESRFTKECSVKGSIDSLSKDKSTENCYNENKHILIPSEVFNRNCSSEISTELLRRLSLMNQFDPLHSMHQTMKVSDTSCNSYDIREMIESFSEIYDPVFPKEIVNKSISKDYVGDTLISLASPMRTAKPIFPKVLFSENVRPIKKYSQQEFQQALKVQELSLQTKYSEELLEYKKTCAAKNQELHSELSKLTFLRRSYSAILSEISAVLESLRTSNEKNKAKLEDLCLSNERLKIDINATKEDSCNMESAFSDIYKRYETAKSMIKNYKENEKHLSKNIESMQSALVEQETVNDLLKSRIQELKGNAAKEIDDTKKSADTQIMILEAQLKKCEIKICSLENDLKQARSDRDNFGNIYDDLMKNFRT